MCTHCPPASRGSFQEFAKASGTANAFNPQPDPPGKIINGAHSTHHS
jgi:hypothetical protein